jgi:type 1 fimbriae regulatory protein FimB/type 1 fimbriae regulatory protein FimE
MGSTNRPPGRRPNAEVRSREYLTKAEVERLQRAAAGLGRYGHRDATMILLAFRHGLRAAELVSLRWDQVDLEAKILHVRRVKKGSPSTHPLLRDELTALKKLKGERIGPVFRSELGGKVTPDRFGTIVARAGAKAELGFPTHPHMLRHACGFHLANAGHDTRAIQAWLGHRNIQHTVRYTELAPDKFKNFFRENGEE